MQRVQKQQCSAAGQPEVTDPGEQVAGNGAGKCAVIEQRKQGRRDQQPGHPQTADPESEEDAFGGECIFIQQHRPVGADLIRDRSSNMNIADEIRSCNNHRKESLDMTNLDNLQASCAAGDGH